jgi:uncharacterized protein
MPARLPYHELRESPIQGRGLFALRRIRRGTRIMEYLGERISPEEADARYDDDAVDRPHTFLFTVSKRVVIDGAVHGNDARYINHSCDPNCEAIIEDQRIFIDAIRTIQPGDEITFDYHLVRPGPWEPVWTERYACRCGAASCRGTMLLKPGRKRAAKKPAKHKAITKKST